MKRLALFLIAILALAPSVANSSQIIPQPWQVLVNNADLVGIVECTTAGEIVARYRVVESWGKGPKKGSEVLIRGPASGFEPTLPLALVGERFLVAAWRWQPAYRFSMGGGPGSFIPEWWRGDRPDYFLPPQNVSLLATRGVGESSPRLFETYRGGLDRLRRGAKALIALPEDQREASVLHALIQFHIEEPAHSTSQHRVRILVDPILLSELERKAKSGNVDTIVTALVSYARKTGPSSRMAVRYVLGGGGGRRSMECLSRILKTEGDFDVGTLSSVIETIRRRLDPRDDHRSRELGPKPPRQKLQAMRFALKEPAEDPKWRGEVVRTREEKRARNWQEAFKTLTTYDPDYVAAFLENWQNPGYGVYGQSEGYGIGSYFGWKDAGNRLVHFRRLLRARDPYIRVAAAIYLSFESEAEGLVALRECARIPGDPGAWAALSLARRGDRKAVARALEAFRTYPRNWAADGVHRNLQKRLLVLLSNSAARSGVVQPERSPYVENAEQQLRVYQRLVTWWNQNEARITIRDPRFEELAARKME